MTSILFFGVIFFFLLTFKAFPSWLFVQHIFSQTYGQATRRLKGNPADCYTSAAYIRFSENRPLLSNEFELKHPLHYNHLTLLQPGVGNLGPLPEGAR
jgi:hypothetical protein